MGAIFYEMYMPFKIASVNKDLKNGIVVLENTDPAADVTKITLSPYTREVMLVVNSSQALGRINNSDDWRGRLKNEIIIPDPFNPTTVIFSWPESNFYLSESVCKLFASFICNNLETKFDNENFVFLSELLIKGINVSFESHIHTLLEEKNYDGVIKFVKDVKDQGIPDSEKRLMQFLLTHLDLDDPIKDIFVNHYAAKFIQEFDAQVKGAFESKTEVKSVPLDVKDSPPPKRKTPDEILADGFAEAEKLKEIFGWKIFLKFGEYLQNKLLFQQALDVFIKIKGAGTHYKMAQLQCANIYFNNWDEDEVQIPQIAKQPLVSEVKSEVKKEVKSLDDDEEEQPLAPKTEEELTEQEVKKIACMQQALRHAVNADEQNLASRIVKSLAEPDIFKGALADASFSHPKPITKTNMDQIIKSANEERARKRNELRLQATANPKSEDSSQAAAYAAAGMLRSRSNSVGGQEQSTPQHKRRHSI